MIAFACVSYLLMMVGANLLVDHFGPTVSPINAFVIIGFDLAIRDWLHVRMSKPSMLLLIATAGLVTYLANPAAQQIAVASSVAFVLAAVADYAVFSCVSGSWLKRSNSSNIASSAVDSLVFTALAFGQLLPGIVVLQFAAKVSGSAVWSLLINWHSKSAIDAARAAQPCNQPDGGR